MINDLTDSSKSSKIAAIIVVLTCLFAVYSSTIFVSYGFGDDYPQLVEATGYGAKWIVPFNFGWGRIITGYLIENAFRLAGTVDHLRYLRLVEVVEVSILAMLIFKQTITATGSAARAAALSIFVCTLPPFQIAVAWATETFMTLPAILSLIAYRLAVSLPCESWQSPPFRIRFASTIAVLWVCFNIYQPTTGFFWFWFVLDVVATHEGAKVHFARFAKCVGSYAIAAGIYYLIFKATGVKNPRAELSTSLVEKSRWFFGQVLPICFRFQLIEASFGFGTALLIGASIIRVWISRELLTNRITKLVLCVATLPLSYLPNLVVAETFATSRSRIALESICGLLAVQAAWDLSNRFRNKFPAVGVGLIIVAVSAAAHSVLMYVVVPQAIEYKEMTLQLSKINLSKCKSIELLPPDLNSRNFADPYFFEFRVPSTAFPPEWGIATTMVQSALADVSPEWLKRNPLRPIHVLGSNEIHNPRAALIDMRGAESLPRGN